MLALRLASYGSPAPAGSRRSSVRTQANTGRTGARAKTGSSSRSMEKPGPLQDRPPLKAATPAGDADEVERLKALLADERAKARGGILSAALALATVLVLPPTVTDLQRTECRSLGTGARERSLVHLILMHDTAGSAAGDAAAGRGGAAEGTSHLRDGANHFVQRRRPQQARAAARRPAAAATFRNHAELSVCVV